MINSDHIVVARNLVPRHEARCISCGEPFKFGGNIFTKEGWAEVGITGYCENCFDGLFEGEEE